MKYKIRYDDKDGSLWATVDGVNYMISQSSGELVGADGHRISDLYWSDTPNGSAEVVKNIFSDIAAQAATIAQLREVEQIARIIITNRNNFTDKHPMVKLEAEAILDALAAALAALEQETK